MIDKLSIKSLNAVEAIKGCFRDEQGAALVEYGMLVGLIAVLCVGAVTILGTTIQGYFLAINAAL